MLFGLKKTEYRDIIIAYKRAFGTSEGNKVLTDLMNRYHILKSHKGDPYAEGQRSVVIEIMKNCHINLEALDKKLKGEANDVTN